MNSKKKCSQVFVLLLLSIVAQYVGSLACGQNPSTDTDSSTESKTNQEPIKPVYTNNANTMKSSNDESEDNFESTKEKKVESVGEAIDAAATKVSNMAHDTIADPIYAFREKFSNWKDSLSGAAEKARTSVSNALHNIGHATMEKLKESELFVSEKFRPLVDSAIQILSRPGTTEKQRWDQLTENVNSAGLSVADKHEFYDKVIKATKND